MLLHLKMLAATLLLFIASMISSAAAAPSELAVQGTCDPSVSGKLGCSACEECAIVQMNNNNCDKPLAQVGFTSEGCRNLAFPWNRFIVKEFTRNSFDQCHIFQHWDCDFKKGGWARVDIAKDVCFYPVPDFVFTSISCGLNN